MLWYLFGTKASPTSAMSRLYASNGNEHDTDALATEGDLRGDIPRDEAERLVLYYNRRGLKGSPNVLRWLLGHEPTSVEAWVDAQLEAVEAR